MNCIPHEVANFVKEQMLESFVLCDHLHVETRESQQLYFIALVFKGELRNCVLLEKGCSIYKVVSTRTFTHFQKKRKIEQQNFKQILHSSLQQVSEIRWD